MQATKQATNAPEQKDGNQDFQRQQNKLDNRYGKIGISAVAAACAHTGKQEGVSEYRIPYDRD